MRELAFVRIVDCGFDDIHAGRIISNHEVIEASQNMLTEQIKKELVARITATEKVDKILLSQATGDSRPDSDIDLLVVLDNETLPHSFKERSANFLHVSRAIRDHFKI